jgi:hypothetical protein
MGRGAGELGNFLMVLTTWIPVFIWVSVVGVASSPRFPNTVEYAFHDPGTKEIGLITLSDGSLPTTAHAEGDARPPSTTLVYQCPV